MYLFWHSIASSFIDRAYAKRRQFLWQFSISHTSFPLDKSCRILLRIFLQFPVMVTHLSLPMRLARTMIIETDNGGRLDSSLSVPVEN